MIRDIEAARKPLTLQMAQRLAEVLDVEAVSLYTRHALDEWRADLDSTPSRYDSVGRIQIGLAKTRHMVNAMVELQALPDLLDEMRAEVVELTLRTADELARLGDATRDIAPPHGRRR